MEGLESIQNQFLILNKYKEELKKNKDKTTNEEEIKKIDKDLKAIDMLMDQLNIEVNENNNYNNEEKTTKEKYEEIKRKVKEIVNQSKQLEPEINEQDKQERQKKLLEAGFVETETVDNRKILIHPSLATKYYNLIKEQRILAKLLYEELLKEENNNIRKIENEETNSKEKTEESNSNYLNIGSIVTIVPESKVYMNEDSAIREKEEDKQTPYYKDPEEKRVILGLAISKDDKLYRIYAFTKEGKAKVEEILNTGGEVESVLTANCERIEKLKNYKGEYLSAEEINNFAEGWYNINSITINNKNTYFK